MARHYNPSHRRQAAQWARGLFARNFYVLDTETTGLGSDAEIVQIGIVDAAGATVMNQLVKPSQPIPRGATRIHGISDADVADAPAFMRLYIRLSSLLAGEVVVGYNMDFDWRMLQQNASRLWSARDPQRQTRMRHETVRPVPWQAWQRRARLCLAEAGRRRPQRRHPAVEQPRRLARRPFDIGAFAQDGGVRLRHSQALPASNANQSLFRLCAGQNRL